MAINQSQIGNGNEDVSFAPNIIDKLLSVPHKKYPYSE